MKNMTKKSYFLIISVLVISFLLMLGSIGVLNIKAATAAADKSLRSSVKSNARQIGRWLKTVEERPALTKKDKDAKKKITDKLSTAKNKSGYLSQTPWYNIEYVSNADEFFVEIKDPNTQFSKYWATMWFKLNGVSDDGICKLPVVYYVNWDVANKIKDLNIEFNPLADTCK